MITVTMLHAGEVGRQFHLLEPLFAEVCDRAVKGEYTASDLKRLAEDGAALLGYAAKDGRIVLAGAFELVRYPRKSVLNVMALGGEGLREAAVVQLEHLMRFARHCGASDIQAMCSRPMARLLAPLGFEHAYEVVRLPVTVKGESDVEHQPA